MAANILERKVTVVIAANKYELVAIPAPARANLSKVIVKQNGGTSVAFVVDVFDKPNASGQTTAAEYADPYSPTTPADTNRIVDQIAGTSGNAAKYRDPLGQPYQNSEGSTQTGRESRIWMVIAPTASATSTTWEVAVTFTENIGT